MKYIKQWYPIISILLATLLVGVYAFYHLSSTKGTLITTSSLNISTSTLPTNGLCKGNLSLPDPKCTPGAVLTTDKNVICVPGYTKNVRNVSMEDKQKVFEMYGIDYSLRNNYEVDHLISLELGGSNDVSNLWPEPYLIDNGAGIKDRLENLLHQKMCDGKISVEEAQKEIAADWLKYYEFYQK
jgi:hypothetical protein